MSDLSRVTTVLGMRVDGLAVDDDGDYQGADSGHKKLFYKHRYMPDDEPEIYEDYPKRKGGRFIENFIWSDWTDKNLTAFVRHMSKKGINVSVFETRETYSKQQIDS